MCLNRDGLFPVHSTNVLCRLRTGHSICCFNPCNPRGIVLIRPNFLRPLPTTSHEQRFLYRIHDKNVRRCSSIDNLRQLLIVMRHPPSPLGSTRSYGRASERKGSGLACRLPAGRQGWRFVQKRGRGAGGEAKQNLTHCLFAKQCHAFSVEPKKLLAQSSLSFPLVPPGLAPPTLNHFSE